MFKFRINLFYLNIIFPSDLRFFPSGKASRLERNPNISRPDTILESLKCNRRPRREFMIFKPLSEGAPLADVNVTKFYVHRSAVAPATAQSGGVAPAS
ncbi:hypothetical protein EVAR_92328_1 [Eumeta japonica]|uniref:Uncharacterized protein n=1 Tax=Eumeta variegata TaxID=151549 RepID=A0A4C1TLK3_EUMVA|nr:hypothetical protein EVAR_92328_1 [Eumeta japonica]